MDQQTLIIVVIAVVVIFLLINRKNEGEEHFQRYGPVSRTPPWSPPSRTPYVSPNAGDWTPYRAPPRAPNTSIAYRPPPPTLPPPPPPVTVRPTHALVNGRWVEIAY